MKELYMELAERQAIEEQEQERAEYEMQRELHFKSLIPNDYE